jgi:gliding motility-associated-like protein
MRIIKNISFLLIATLIPVGIECQVANFDIDTNQVCASLANASKVVVTNLSVPATDKNFGDYTYSWTFGGAKSIDKADASFTQNLSAVGVLTFKLEMKYDNKVVSSKDTSFFARPFPNAWFTVADTFSIAPLTYRFRSGKAPSDTIKYKYLWKLDNSNDTFAYQTNIVKREVFVKTFSTTGLHKMSLFVNDNFGCKDRFDTTFMVSDKLEVPKFFTPNGDNQNDYLRVETNGREIYRFEVYTSRGQRIFSSESRSIIWDGLIEDSGQPAPPGTYYYFIEPVGSGGKAKASGFFVLFREK